MTILSSLLWELWQLWQTYKGEFILGAVYGLWSLPVFMLGMIWRRYDLEFGILALLLWFVPSFLLCWQIAIYWPYQIGELEKGVIRTTATVVHYQLQLSQDSVGTLVYRYEVPQVNGERRVYFGRGAGGRYSSSNQIQIVYAQSDPSVSHIGLSFKPKWRQDLDRVWYIRLTSWVMLLFWGGLAVWTIVSYIPSKRDQLRYQKKMRVVEARHARHAERGVRAVRKMIELEAQREEEARRKQSQRKQQ